MSNRIFDTNSTETRATLRTEALRTDDHFDSLLERHARRRTHRVAEFPPDFVHGEASLDELYETFGEEWVEQAAFIQHHAGPDGQLLAVSVATFSDWFLRVEHVAVDDHRALTSESLHRWLEEQLEGRRVVVELQTSPGQCAGFDHPHWIDVQCPSHRLVELERTFLSVHRDGCHDWATHAQTNLLSLITLCARLGMERVN